MEKAKTLPWPYFRGEGQVLVMLGAALSAPRRSGCLWDHGLPWLVAPSTGTIRWHNPAKAAETVAKSHVLGFLVLLSLEEGMASPCTGWDPRGWVRCGGTLPPAGSRTWPWVPLVTCLWLSPRQLPAAWGLCSLGAAWGQLGHSLSLAYSCVISLSPPNLPSPHPPGLRVSPHFSIRDAGAHGCAWSPSHTCGHGDMGAAV